MEWVTSMEQYGVGDRSCIRVYHVFKYVWTPTIGERLSCKREIEEWRWYAVAVIRDRTTVGNIPRRISAACSLAILFSAAYFQTPFLLVCSVLARG